ncbi:MAG TPA: hypothetical protein VGO11_13825 [Chthoniobacteraceae bacterium]|jgi:hypothetical protein|nr:hypothetical protein [Chthoniobacteraceae bacterium]
MRSLLLLLLLLSPCAAAERVVHIFVALADNASQGIERVPPKIGNGDDAENNLYWGCDDGVKAVFMRSKVWKRVAATDPDGDGPILQRLVFHNAAADAWLVADGYRGKEIKQCLTDYLAALAGTLKAEAAAGERTVAAGGAADFVAYAGHDGLMEFQLETPAAAAGRKPKTAIALCCVSRTFFAGHLAALKVEPLLLTTQLMYPAAQVLHDSINGWLAGKDGRACVQLAGAAYARNQKISQRAAAGVFSTGLPEKE